jgi:hypothetical protein
MSANTFSRYQHSALTQIPVPDRSICLIYSAVTGYALRNSGGCLAPSVYSFLLPLPGSDGFTHKTADTVLDDFDPISVKKPTDEWEMRIPALHVRSPCFSTPQMRDVAVLAN